MDIDQARVLGALDATYETRPATVPDLAALAGLSVPAVRSWLEVISYAGMAKTRGIAPDDRWQITGAGHAVAHRPHNREYLKTLGGGEIQ